ncbi:MAG: tail fiber domain-containing protein [Thermoanaerobaculales bacterium]
MSNYRCTVLVVMIACVAAVSHAQPAGPLDPPLVNWTAPPYWTPAMAQHVARPEGPSAQAFSADRDVSVEATPETPLTGALPFVAIPPCRLVDTRHGPKDVQQPGGGTPGYPRGSYGNGQIRSYDLTSSADCTGLPAGVGAWSLQFQFTTATQASYLEAWPYSYLGGIGGQSVPASESTMLGYTDRWTANSAVIPAGNDGKGSINVFVEHAGDVIVEVNGYYGPQGVVTSLTGGVSMLTGDVTLAQGYNVTITAAGNTLTIGAGGAGGTLPTGTTGQTLYSNGSGWLASSVLTNDGSSNVGVNGDLNLPATTSSSSGVINLGASQAFIHAYGTLNSFFGYAGNFTMTGQNNIGVGYTALNMNTSGSGNTATGKNALGSNTSGSLNTATGYNAAYNNSTANNNTAVGAGALYFQGAAFDNGGTPWDADNTAIGYEALRNNKPTSSANGRQNTAVGSGAMRQNNTGPYNTAIGYQSLYNNGNGSYNTVVGELAGFQNQTGSNNVFLGNEAGYWETGSDRLYIANGPDMPLIFGEFDKNLVGINATDPLTEMDVNGKIRARDWTGAASSTYVCRDPIGVLVPCSSDVRLKANIVSLGEEKDVLAVLAALRGVAFDWDRSNPKAANAGPNREIGFIAQEVEAVLPEVVHVEADGYRSMDYAKLTALLVEVAKAQQAQIEALVARLAAIEARLAAK